jgi:DNA-binding CsgD family transcriptional regulator
MLFAMGEGSVIDRMSAAELARRRADVVAACERVTDTDEVLRVMSERLGAVVPHDGSCWFGTDPETHFASLPVRIENVEQGHCTTYWDREFTVDDVLLFRRMVDERIGAATLHEATDGLPARSTRYREFLAPQEFGDELRMTLQTSGSNWGLVALMRHESAGLFTKRETAFLGGIAQALAEVLRRNSLLKASETITGIDAPGVITFDESGVLMSMNEAAAAWFDELEAGVTHPDDPPVPVVAVLAHARAVARGRQRGSAMLRVRGRSGRWATLHASRLGHVDSDADPGCAPMVVVIEQASPSQLRSILQQAFGLSPREQQVTARLARGMSTGAIAAELFLSEHTVRDHVKSIFAKVGVTSRTELVAYLYAEHLAPDHAAAVEIR